MRSAAIAGRTHTFDRPPPNGSRRKAVPVPCGPECSQFSSWGDRQYRDAACKSSDVANEAGNDGYKSRVVPSSAEFAKQVAFKPPLG